MLINSKQFYVGVNNVHDKQICFVDCKRPVHECKCRQQLFDDIKLDPDHIVDRQKPLDHDK